MTFRKQRRPTPGFGVPPPFKPVTGTHSTLREDGTFPYCAMMQVAAADTYTDYVVCRGFDPRIRKFVDYVAGDPNKPGISVAKPYGNRTIGEYAVAEMYPAFLPTQGVVGEGKSENYVPPSPTTVDWRVGQNAGKATTAHTGGHPTALVDTVTELVDHNGVNVQWMLVDRGTGSTTKVQWGIAQHNWQDDEVDCPFVQVKLCEDCDGTNPTGSNLEVLLPRANDSDPNVIAGEVIGWMTAIDGSLVCVTDYMDDRIRTGKLWTGADSDIPAGWGTMDGAANSVANGGSGIDVNNKFLRGATGASGNTGGEPNHTHEVTVTIPDHLEYDLFHSHTHTLLVDVDPHTVEELNHNHGLGDTPGDDVKEWETGDPKVTLPYFRTCTEEAWGAIWEDVLEEWQVDYTTCGINPYGPLYHNVSVEGGIGAAKVEIVRQKHYPVAVCDTVDNLPEYVEMQFIERLDNRYVP